MKQTLLSLILVLTISLQAFSQTSTKTSTSISLLPEKSKSVSSQPSTVTAPQPTKSESAVSPKADYSKMQLASRALPSPANGFGYEISADGKKIIVQPATSLAGGNGFKTQADAVKAAHLIVDKIKKGDRSPVLTTEELKSFGLTK